MAKGLKKNKEKTNFSRKTLQSTGCCNFVLVLGIFVCVSVSVVSPFQEEHQSALSCDASDSF